LCIRNKKCILLAERGKIRKKYSFYVIWFYMIFLSFFSVWWKRSRVLSCDQGNTAVNFFSHFYLFIIILTFLIRRLAKLVLPKYWHFVHCKRKKSIGNLCISPKIHAFHEISIRKIHRQFMHFMKIHEKFVHFTTACCKI
jgi:hypothetical protein